MDNYLRLIMLLTDPLDIALFMRAKEKAKRDCEKKLLYMTKLLLLLHEREYCPECRSGSFYQRRTIDESYIIYSDGHLNLEDTDGCWDNSYCYDCDYED